MPRVVWYASSLPRHEGFKTGSITADRELLLVRASWARSRLRREPATRPLEGGLGAGDSVYVLPEYMALTLVVAARRRDIACLLVTAIEPIRRDNARLLEVLVLLSSSTILDRLVRRRIIFMQLPRYYMLRRERGGSNVKCQRPTVICHGYGIRNNFEEITTRITPSKALLAVITYRRQICYHA